MATNLTIDEVTQNVTLVVSNERGPAGPAGPNSVTSATTSDGTANLSLASATVTGTLTASHIHGNLAGSIYMHVRAGEALSKGDPVYVSGSHGTGASMVPVVMRADASNASKMPAIAIMDAAVANNGDGHAVINGTITDLNTQAYPVNGTLYVANGGGMTDTKPANAQPVARVERSNLNNGGIVVKVNGLYSDVTIASSQVTDATSAATAGTIVKRDGDGSAAFDYVTANTFDGNANAALVTLGGGSNFLTISNEDGTTPIAYFECQADTAATRYYTFPDATGTVILDSTLGAGVNGLTTITGAKSFSGQVSLTGQAATDDNSAMTRGLADARYYPQAIAYKPSDTSISSSTTRVSDPHLIIPVEAYSIYSVEGSLLIPSNASNINISAALVIPSGSIRIRSLSGRDGAVAGTQLIVTSTNALFTNTRNGSIHFTGTIFTGATLGNLAIQWAQETSSATAVTLLQGSNLIIRKLQ